MNDFINVKVGDIVCIRKRFSEYIVKVEKVNKTTFVASAITFRKNNGVQYGGDAWSRAFASIPTEEDVLRINENNKRAKLISSIVSKATYPNLENRSTDTLETIYKLLESEGEKCSTQ